MGMNWIRGMGKNGGEDGRVGREGLEGDEGWVRMEG